MQRTLAAATAFSALPLGVEIYFEHFRGSFGDKWMWTPVALSPALTVAGVAGVRSERAARTVAAGRLGALLPRRGDRGDHPRARRRAQARGLPRAAVQHRDGAAAAGARDRWRWSAGWGWPRRRSAASADGSRLPPAPSTCPTCARTASPPRPRSCPASATASRRRCTAATPTTTCSTRPTTGTRSRGGWCSSASSRSRRCASSPDAEARTLGAFCDLRDGPGPRAEDPGAEHGRRQAVRRQARRLPLRRHARRPRDLAPGRRRASTRRPPARREDFAGAPHEVQHDVVQAFSDGRASRRRCGTSCRRTQAWSVVMRAVLSAFYSHPWAWNEIGFGGPAYPRGYARLGVGPARELGGRSGVRAAIRSATPASGGWRGSELVSAPRPADRARAVRCARPRTTRPFCSTSTGGPCPQRADGPLRR